jgi:hypothetical protein
MNGRTQWFKFVEYRPVHVGWYEGSAGEGSRVWQVYWDGTSFRTCAEGVLTSASYWRGLTFEEYGRQRFNVDEDARVERELANRGWMGAKPTTAIDWERWAQRHTTPLPTIACGNLFTDGADINLPEHMRKRWAKGNDSYLDKPEPSPYEIMRDAFDHVSKLLIDSGETLRKQGMGWPKVHSRCAAEVQLENFLAMNPNRLAQVNFANAKSLSTDEVPLFARITKFHNMLKDNAAVFTALTNHGTR